MEKIYVIMIGGLIASSIHAETIDEAMRNQYRGSEAYCDVDPSGGRTCVNLTAWCESKDVRKGLTVEACIKEKRSYLTQKNHEEWEAYKNK